LNYVTVITADVVGSKKIETFEDNFKDTLINFNHSGLLTPFSISRGDEIQALVKGWLSYPEIIRQLRNSCRPLKLRIGIGIGNLADHLSNNSWDLNGPPFHLARKSLEETTMKKTDTCTIFHSWNEEFDVYINSILLLLDSIQSKWTEEQWEAVHAYEEFKTFDLAAQHLNIRLQNVQKRCKAAKWSQVLEAENSLRKIKSYLNQFHPLEGENTNFTL